MQRREFIRNTCFACMGIAGFSAILESCGTPKSILKTDIQNNQIKIPLENLSQSKTQIIQNAQLPYNILVVKNENNFTALQMRCTHNDFALNFTGSKIVCNAHGSEFDLKGNVQKAPAEKSLTQYRTNTDNNFLIIHLK